MNELKFGLVSLRYTTVNPIEGFFLKKSRITNSAWFFEYSPCCPLIFKDRLASKYFAKSPLDPPSMAEITGSIDSSTFYSPKLGWLSKNKERIKLKRSGIDLFRQILSQKKKCKLQNYSDQLSSTFGRMIR